VAALVADGRWLLLKGQPNHHRSTMFVIGIDQNTARSP